MAHSSRILQFAGLSIVPVPKPVDVIVLISRYEGKRGLYATENSFHEGAVAPLEQGEGLLHVEGIIGLRPRKIYQLLPWNREPWKNVCISGFVRDVLVFENDLQVSI